MKSYTDIEQSKKLAEFLPPESEDMEYLRLRETNAMIGSVPFVKDESEVENSAYDAVYERIPCWSLAALMKLLPSEFTTENELGKYRYEIKICKYKLADDVDIHQIAYGNYKRYEDGSHSWKDMINTGEKEELLDAAFEMVCWLKENNKI